MPTGENIRPVRANGGDELGLRAHVLLAVGFGCLVAFEYMVSLGFVGYLAHGFVRSVDAWYGLRTATTLLALAVLALAGWFRWFRVGTTGILLATAAAVAAPIVFAVDDMGSWGAVTAVLGGGSTAVLMFAWMLLLSCFSVRQILGVTIGGLLLAGAIVMGVPLLDNALALVVAVAAAFASGAAALLVNADSYVYEGNGKIDRSAAARMPWLTVVMVLACGFLASVLYGVAEHLTWLYDWSPNPVSYVVAVVATLAATVLIILRSPNWMHLVWAPSFGVLVLALGFSCFSVRESIQVAVGFMLAAVLCARVLHWVIFPALFSTLKVPRAFLAGIMLIVAEGSLARMLGDALGSILPHSMQNLGGVAGIMILVLGSLFAVTYLVYHRLFGSIGFWAPPDRVGVSGAEPDSPDGEGEGELERAQDDEAEAGRDGALEEGVPGNRDEAPATEDSANPVDALKAHLDLLSAEYGLTPREREVALFTVQGYSCAYISEKLVVSNSTVRFHQQNIYRKFDVHSRNELIEIVSQGD